MRYSTGIPLWHRHAAATATMLWVIMACTTMLGTVHGQEDPALDAYHIDAGRVTVSGISSGAYMAGQVHVAFSSLFVASGSLAGGPYYCAQGSVSTALSACMQAPNVIDVDALISYAQQQSSLGTIDDVENLAKAKIYLFHGTRDGTVDPGTSPAYEEFLGAFVDPSQVKTNYELDAGHAHVTDFFGNGCTTSTSPYINKCEDGDIVGEMFRWFEANTTERGSYASSNLHRFDQSEFGGISMADTGFLYVPTSCANNEVPSGCGLHVAFHGCQQNFENIGVGTDYVEFAGYNEYAETNNLIILYPQTVVSYVPNNPNACWDWWGYAGSDYALKSGSQMSALKDMVDRIMSGAPTVLPPEDLSVVEVTDDSVSFQWTEVSDIDHYKVFRDFEAIAEEVQSTEYTDEGLLSGTQYTYTVQSVNSEDHHSPHSEMLIVTTTGMPPPLSAPSNLYCADVGPDYTHWSWDKVSGAVYYTLVRDGGVRSINSTTTSAVDDELEPETTYSYTVFAANCYEVGPSSDAANVTTTSGWTCQEFFDNNYNHVQEDRAYVSLGFVYAVGSDEYMGLYNVADFTNLAEVEEGYYIVGSC